MPQKTLIAVAVILIVLLGSVGVAVAAPGRISGLLELRYGEHTATENGSKVLDASHFTQKYSLLWKKEGRLMRGRMGKYNVVLGYEWSWVDSKRDDNVKIEIDNPLDKILYRGDITIAPGGLPFNMRLYSYDMHSTNFEYSELSEIFNLPNKGRQGGTITSVQDGTYKITGMSLNAGVTNGNYAGKYRDLLATVPKLLIDYRQVDVHDIKGPFKRNYVDRDLAFVSLNKKNNWLHYRVFSHEDKLDSTQNYREQTYLLGTINHRNQREWVNLTNWIQVSSDISYSEHIPNPGDIKNLQKRYSLNLFAKASRTRWRGSSFTSFHRLGDSDSLDKKIYVPFFANGELNRDTSWRFRFIGARYQRDYFTGIKENTGNVFVSGKVETFRQSRFILSPLVEAEQKAGTEGDGFAGRVGAEFYSNSAYRSPYDFHGSIDMRYFNGTANSGINVDYVESTVSARIQKDFNAVLRGGFEQKLVFGNGIYDNTVSDNIVSGAELVQTGKSGQRSTGYRSTTAVFLDHRSPSRLRNRVGASVDYLTGSVDDGLRLFFDHSLEYLSSIWSGTTATSFLTGDALPSVSGQNIQSARNQFNNTSRISYAPSRAVSGSVRFVFDWYDYGNESSLSLYNLHQLAEYSIWSHAGVVRKRIVFGQEFEIEKNIADARRVGNDFIAFTLFTDYYPTRATLLGARLRYDIDDTLGTDSLSCYLTAGIDFRQFKLSVDYSYGDRSAGDTVAQRKEQRWEVKVLKTF